MTEADRGIAYGLWERVDQELFRQRKSQRWLVAASGIPATTINRLKTTKRPPAAHIIVALADALGIDETEARILAGRTTASDAPDAEPPDTPVDPFEAIRNSPLFTDEQKRTLLQVAEALAARNITERDAATGARRTG